MVVLARSVAAVVLGSALGFKKTATYEQSDPVELNTALEEAGEKGSKLNHVLSRSTVLEWPSDTKRMTSLKSDLQGFANAYGIADEKSLRPFWSMNDENYDAAKSTPQAYISGANYFVSKSALPTEANAKPVPVLGAQFQLSVIYKCLSFPGEQNNQGFSMGNLRMYLPSAVEGVLDSQKHAIDLAKIGANVGDWEKDAEADTPTLFNMVYTADSSKANAMQILSYKRVSASQVPDRLQAGAQVFEVNGNEVKRTGNEDIISAGYTGMSFDSNGIANPSAESFAQVKDNMLRCTLKYNGMQLGFQDTWGNFVEWDKDTGMLANDNDNTSFSFHRFRALYNIMCPVGVKKKDAKSTSADEIVYAKLYMVSGKMMLIADESLGACMGDAACTRREIFASQLFTSNPFYAVTSEYHTHTPNSAYRNEQVLRKNDKTSVHLITQSPAEYADVSSFEAPRSISLDVSKEPNVQKLLTAINCDNATRISKNIVNHNSVQSFGNNDPSSMQEQFIQNIARNVHCSRMAETIDGYEVLVQYTYGLWLQQHVTIGCGGTIVFVNRFNGAWEFYNRWFNAVDRLERLLLTSVDGVTTPFVTAIQSTIEKLRELDQGKSLNNFPDFDEIKEITEDAFKDMKDLFGKSENDDTSFNEILTHAQFLLQLVSDTYVRRGYACGWNASNNLNEAPLKNTSALVLNGSDGNLTGGLEEGSNRCPVSSSSIKVSKLSFNMDDGQCGATGASLGPGSVNNTHANKVLNINNQDVTGFCVQPIRDRCDDKIVGNRIVMPTAQAIVNDRKHPSDVKSQSLQKTNFNDYTVLAYDEQNEELAYKKENGSGCCRPCEQLLCIVNDYYVSQGAKECPQCCVNIATVGQAEAAIRKKMQGLHENFAKNLQEER